MAWILRLEDQRILRDQPSAPPDLVRLVADVDALLLSFSADEPGWQFVRHVAVGLTISLVLLAGLAALLMR